MYNEKRVEHLYELARGYCKNPPESTFDCEFHSLSKGKYSKLPLWERIARSMAECIVNQPVMIDPDDRIIGRVFHSNCGCPVISFTAEGISSDLVAEMLSKRGICVRSGLHCAPLAHCTLGTENGGTVRISPYFANTEIDCNHLIKSICELK